MDCTLLSWRPNLVRYSSQNQHFYFKGYHGVSRLFQLCFGFQTSGRNDENQEVSLFLIDSKNLMAVPWYKYSGGFFQKK